MHIAAPYLTLYVSCRTDARHARVDRAQDRHVGDIRAIHLFARGQSVLELADGPAKTQRLAARIISSEQATGSSGAY